MKIEMGAAEQHNKGSEIELPGFRFHPTEQELVGFYLKKMVQGKLHNFNFIGMLDLYRYDPWDLPSLSRWGERELFFFVPRDKKCQNGGRPNRITACGYWKATGSDRFVRDEHGKPLGLKKTLVFYKGRAPRGQKTDWVMNEYRMPEADEAPRREVVLCRIHRKATPLKWLEQRAMSQAAAGGGAQNSMDDDLDYKSQETSMVSSLETKPLNVKIERDEVKKFHQFEASSSMEENTTTHSDVTSSQGCYPVDSISELNQFMESTVYGGFIDPVFQAFGSEEGKKNIEGFSSLMAMFNNSGNANISYDFGGGGFDSVFPEVEDQAKFNVPKLSLDFNCLSRSNNTQEKNPLIDLWSPSSLLCTPHSQEQS